MPTTQKIRYSDCDPQGIVFNGNYARYWDDAITDWLEENGFGGVELGGIGVDVVTAHLEIDFRQGAGLGDQLETSIEVASLGKTSMKLAVTTRKDEDVIAEGHVVYVFVDPVHFRPVAVPAEIRALSVTDTPSSSAG